MQTLSDLLFGSLAGQRIGGAAPQDGAATADGTAAADEAAQAAERDLAEWLRQDTDPEQLPGLRTRAVTQRDLLTGSSFAMTGGMEGSGLYSLWGRGAVTRFDGREGDLTLDGEVVSGMLGTDWTRDALTAGLVVAHSRGEGGYASPVSRATCRTVSDRFMRPSPLADTKTGEPLVCRPSGPHPALNSTGPRPNTLWSLR